MISRKFCQNTLRASKANFNSIKNISSNQLILEIFSKLWVHEIFAKMAVKVRDLQIVFDVLRIKSPQFLFLANILWHSLCNYTFILYCPSISRNILQDTHYTYYLMKNAQCGNYGNSLSRIFGKNFVKVTVLLNKLLNKWFDKIFFQWE